MLPDKPAVSPLAASVDVSKNSTRESPIAVLSDPACRHSWIDRGQIPGLDGLRAIAVMMVLMAHGHQTVGFPDSPLLKHLFLQGAIGVDIFFILSGFLITTLLARELERDGHVQLKRFYLRRLLRIMPAYICLLVVVALCQQAGYFQLQSRDWIRGSHLHHKFFVSPVVGIGTLLVAVR